MILPVGFRAGDLIVIGKGKSRVHKKGSEIPTSVVRCKCGSIEVRANQDLARVARVGVSAKCCACRSATLARSLRDKRSHTSRIARDKIARLYADAGTIWNWAARNKLVSELEFDYGVTLLEAGDGVPFSSVDPRYVKFADLTMLHGNQSDDVPGICFSSSAKYRGVCVSCGKRGRGHVCLRCSSLVCFDCAESHECGKPAVLSRSAASEAIKEALGYAMG